MQLLGKKRHVMGEKMLNTNQDFREVLNMSSLIEIVFFKTMPLCL